MLLHVNLKSLASANDNDLYNMCKPLLCTKIIIAYLEANIFQLLNIYNDATIKDESRFLHAGINGRPIKLLELFPFRCNYDSLSLLASFDGRAAN